MNRSLSKILSSERLIYFFLLKKFFILDINPIFMPSIFFGTLSSNFFKIEFKFSRDILSLPSKAETIVQILYFRTFLVQMAKQLTKSLN